MTFVVVDGVLIAAQDAAISIMHPSFQLGLGVFTTVRVVDRKIFWLQEHIDRVLEHSQKMGFPSVLISEKSVHDLVQRCCVPHELYKLKIIVVPEGKAMSRYFAFVEPYSPTFEDTVRLKSMVQHDTVAADVKSISYAAKWLAREAVKKQGYDDVLFVDGQKNILETSCANVFFKQGNELYFPTRELPLLWGITIGKIQAVVQEHGYVCHEVAIALDALPDDVVMYAANSMIQFRPVIAIDGKEYGQDLLFEKLLASGLNLL